MGWSPHSTQGISPVAVPATLVLVLHSWVCLPHSPLPHGKRVSRQANCCCQLSTKIFSQGWPGGWAGCGSRSVTSGLTVPCPCGIVTSQGMYLGGDDRSGGGGGYSRFLSPPCPQLTPELEVDALRAVLLLFSFGVFSDSDQLPCYLSSWGSERRDTTKGLRGGGAGFGLFWFWRMTLLLPTSTSQSGVHPSAWCMLDNSTY